LAEYIRKRAPNARGFSAQNLWRMRQWYETYSAHPKLSALLRELSWTHNLLILGKCTREEEREFYLRLARAQKWSSRCAPDRRSRCCPQLVSTQRFGR
jgi:hypothetical protein